MLLAGSKSSVERQGMRTCQEIIFIWDYYHSYMAQTSMSVNRVDFSEECEFISKHNHTCFFYFMPSLLC